MFVCFNSKMIVFHSIATKLAMFNSQTGSLRAATGASPQTGKSFTDLEKKVAILEMSVYHGEATIAKAPGQCVIVGKYTLRGEELPQLLHVGFISTVDVVARFIVPFSIHVLFRVYSYMQLASSPCNESACIQAPIVFSSRGLTMAFLRA